LSSRGFSELVLIVEDVPKAARFYEDVVGLTVHHITGDEWHGSGRAKWALPSASDCIAARSCSKSTRLSL